MTRQIFFSHKMDSFVDRCIDLLDLSPTILVPHAQMRQWLLLEIAKRKGIAMGINVLEAEQLFPSPLSGLQMFSLIYSELSQCDDPEILAYLDGKKKRLLDLTEQLAALFFSYGQFGESLFEGSPKGWQQKLLHKLFVSGPWRLPVQLKIDVPDSIICFGIESLPPFYWKAILQAPSVSIFLFSPCIDFWEDLCTDRERKSLNRYWKKRGASKEIRDQLDLFLRQAPKNLANWGKLGRETLKILDQFDLHTEELYPPLESDSLLKRLQASFLMFKEPPKGVSDDSIQLFLTGASRLKEVECLREEILKLGIPYSDISVMAPDIEPYVPLIEFVFGEKIPYRIANIDIAPQSSFRQGLVRLTALAQGRWDAEAVLTLFETPSFYRKRGWDSDLLEQFRKWTLSTHIQWGIDAAHREKTLANTFGKQSYEDRGSWEQGLDQLLDAIVYWTPMQVGPDQLEELIGVLSALQQLPFKGEKSLSAWADCLEAAAEEFLLIEDAADQAAYQSFQNLLIELRISEGILPFEGILRFLLRPCESHIHPSHLHAVRFSSLEKGALLAARAVFLIGMDEDHFPRVKIRSSLDLLQGKIESPDRYLFLQTLFSAGDFLRISYGHLSATEGKPVGPSLLVQELLSSIDVQPVVYRPLPAPLPEKRLVWPHRIPSPRPEGEIAIPISELRQLAHHPWKFFLRKVHGMILNEPLEESFSLQIRTGKNKLTGPLGAALKLRLDEEQAAKEAQLEAWGLKPFSLILRDHCSEPQWEGDNYVMPALRLAGVRLVGEIQQATLKGLICSNEDKISGLLRAWPEALIVGICMNAPQVWMLKNGKVKTIAYPEKSLESFIDYYFQTLTAPSPLLSDWADDLLRKGTLDCEKNAFDDPIIDWVLARGQMGTEEEMINAWGDFLKESFASLIQLYPIRGKNHAEV